MFKMTLLSSAALIIASAACIAMAAERQETAIPNFMSTDFGWLLTTGINFRPIEGKVAPVGGDPYPQGRDGSGPVIRERMSDADNPNLTPWAAAQAKTHNDRVRNGSRAFQAQSRCWPGGTPGQLLFVAEPSISSRSRTRSG